jgi:hypothetical protein
LTLCFTQLQAFVAPGAAVVRDWRILWLAGCWLLIAAVMFGMVS